MQMSLGQKGERLAVKFLRKKGYRIKEKNFKTGFGEIDVIAYDMDTLVFVEVKTRETLTFGQPFEAVNRSKIRKIAKVAMFYLSKLSEVPPCRFDVVSIQYKEGSADCELIKDAFEV